MRKRVVRAIGCGPSSSSSPPTALWRVRIANDARYDDHGPMVDRCLPGQRTAVGGSAVVVAVARRRLCWWRRAGGVLAAASKNARIRQRPGGVSEALLTA